MRQSGPSLGFGFLDGAIAEIARRPWQPELELPTTMDGPMVDPETMKPAARREFERRPSSYLRCSEDGLSSASRLTVDNPRRPVDAGWQIVCNQVHDRLPPTAIEANPWIERAHGYLQRLLDCRDDADQDEVGRRELALHAAYSVYRNPDKFIRGRLEAYLLTGRSFDEVAVACGLSPAAAEAYERLFFSVRDKLEHPILVRSVAFDGKFFQGLLETDVDLLIKMAGLLSDGAALEPMLRYFSSGMQLPDHANYPTRQEVIDLHERVQMRALILAWVLPTQKIERARIVQELADELERLIKGWPENGTAPNQSPFGGGPITDEQLRAWWSSWRQVVTLATRPLPADMSELRNVA